ncbi:trypsin-like peptidase domain-containing protein [Polyangium aurulentum]|uniref:trypsin-like peptidase domain-containing protein n=1 Tax=Polyangium aurulentum TaxID=2567896 RepID=UPI00146D63D8|nr:trypsin-like peptidase domain-containing protein [Polyangium aurulentum]UQA60004.1 trypsin-like peptidase domain-containing protein [Polyangium aurulentum]
MALDIAALVDRVNPAVVSITSSRAAPTPRGLGGLPPGVAPRLQRALGSGFIVSPEGMILTNSHVVHGSKEVRVELSSGRAVDATVVGEDEKLDVALLAAKGAKGLPVVALGTSEEVRVGEYVVAIGNPFGLGHTVTLGIVSAKERVLGVGPFDRLIQTDASINPGSSGGPLFDTRGRVVGINTVMHAQGQGIGFAIPIDDVRAILPELRSKGRVTRGVMGLAFQAISDDLSRALALPSASGAIVTEVEPGGPSDRAGLKPGDVIRTIDGRQISHASDLARALGRKKPGEIADLQVARSGAARGIRVVLARGTEDRSDDRKEGRETEGPVLGGKLGAVVSDEPGGGAHVDAVDARGAAASELEVGDVVVEANGQKVDCGADLARQVDRTPKRGMVLLRLRRDGEALYVAVPMK